MARPTLTAAIAYAVVLGAVFLLTVILPAAGAFRAPLLPIDSGAIREATVVAVLDERVQETPAGNVYRARLLVRVGEREAELDHVYVEGGADAITLAEGDGVLVSEMETAEGTVYTLKDRSRRVSLWVLSLAFALTVVAVGGRHGALSLLGLGVTFLVLVRFIVPATLDGWSPLPTTIVGALAILGASMVLSHGPNPKTWIAIAGTAASLLLTGVLAAFAVGFARLSGVGEESAAILQVLTQGGIDARGLLLAGIIIGALGVLDDVTTTQASTVIELRRANPSLGTPALFARAMNVGRDHIAATTNTLVLAYAGAALPLLLIYAGQPHPLGILVSFDQLATEIVRTLAGSIGIVAAVPVTTALAAILVGSGLVSVEGDERGADA
ncbi:MAG: hypothetical protein AMXMBFR23_04090 [Chloroflexota bacterium]